MFSAYILAGGRSSRMGRDKALLMLSGETLLEVMRRKALEITPQVSVVGPKQESGRDAVEDIFAGCGPLAGIHAALRHSQSELNFILAVDTPLIEIEFLRYLAQRAQASRALAIVPKTSDGWQPLCAIYRRSFADAAEAALQAKRNKIDALFSQVETLAITDDEMRAAGFDRTMFQNLNTPDELAAVAAKLKRERP